MWYAFAQQINKSPSALPDVRKPEGQKTGDSGSNLGLITGVTVAGFLVVATLLIIGFLFTLKLRISSKSKNVPLSINVALGKPNHNLPALSESTKQTLYCKGRYRIKTCKSQCIKKSIHHTCYRDIKKSDAVGNEDCNLLSHTGRAKPDVITTSSNEAYDLVTHSARAEPSINTSSNEAYNIVNLTGSTAITASSNEAYNLATPTARAESASVTTSSNEAYNIVNLTTESTAITTHSNEAYNVVTPNTRAESDTITTNSNEAYPRVMHASRAEYDYVATNKCFTNPFSTDNNGEYTTIGNRGPLNICNQMKYYGGRDSDPVSNEASKAHPNYEPINTSSNYWKNPV